MKRIDDAIERLLIWVAENASGRGIVAVVALFYPGIGLLLPMGLNATGGWLFFWNIIGVTWGFTFAIVWFAARVQDAHRRHLVEWTSDLRRLDAQEFEWLVGELYRREGWQVKEVGQQGQPDGNVDLRMTRGKEVGIAQCKRWTARLVGVDEIRQFAGTLTREGLKGSQGYFVTLSMFTDQARTEAKAIGLNLVDGRDLYERAERHRKTEPCEECHSPMILDRSQHGWWFRCRTPGCGGKRDLGRDPGRALALLVTEDERPP